MTGSGGFFAVKRPPTKAQRREEGMARAESKQARAADPVGLRREQQAAAAEEEARLLAPLAAADKPGSKRKRSAIAAAVLHEDLGAADDGEFLPMPLSYDWKRRCNDVWARWKELDLLLVSPSFGPSVVSDTSASRGPYCMITELFP